MHRAGLGQVVGRITQRVNRNGNTAIGVNTEAGFETGTIGKSDVSS
jgi:hypothetical protein